MILILAGMGGEMGRHKSRPVRASLLITEILYDPDPPIGLPVYEFVEWYNAGEEPVDLVGWQWMVGDKVKRVAGGSLAPGEYVIVCSPAAAAAYRPFGTVIALESFPALVNGGERLSLINPDGVAVHTVEYSPNQFADALKANGGWSLELADFHQYCRADAWLPSVDPSGGTPGRANSQQISLPLADPPMLIRAAGYDDDRFVILFSGPLNPALQMNNYSCIIEPGGISVTAVPAPDYGIPGIFFPMPEVPDRGITYTLELKGDVEDCAGNRAAIRPVKFGFPALPDSAGVVISEVMFDPITGEPEFVEMFNRSGRVVELNSLILARANAEGRVMSFSDQQTGSFWLFPNEYAVLTSDEKLFAGVWVEKDRAIIVERPDMPSLTNEESQLILMDRTQKRLDVVTYSPDWHYPYLDDSKGVSLERIDLNVSGMEHDNWFSASVAVGGATPGAQNSTVLEVPEAGKDIFSLQPAVGFAGGSTDPVQLSVYYQFDNPGWFIRVNIYNSSGLPVRELFPFGMAPLEGAIHWDGLDNVQRIVSDGIYLIVADYYHPSGKKGRWKKACAVVRNY